MNGQVSEILTQSFKDIAENIVTTLLSALIPYLPILGIVLTVFIAMRTFTVIINTKRENERVQLSSYGEFVTMEDYEEIYADYGYDEHYEVGLTGKTHMYKGQQLHEHYAIELDEQEISEREFFRNVQREDEEHRQYKDDSFEEMQNKYF